MKSKIILSLLYLATLAGYLMAQAPGFNYQAVLRDAEGTPMKEADITLVVSLTEGVDGPVLYRERQVLKTDELGLLHTVIGTGAPETGQFADIVGVQDLNIRIEAELPGEPDIVDIGSSRVGAIPFALYGEDADADPHNEMQELTLEEDSLKISGMGGVSLETYAGPWVELPDGSGYQLSLDGGQRSIDQVMIKKVAGDGKIIATSGANTTTIDCNSVSVLVQDQRMVRALFPGLDNLSSSLRELVTNSIQAIENSSGIAVDRNQVSGSINTSYKDREDDDDDYDEEDDEDEGNASLRPPLTFDFKMHSPEDGEVFLATSSLQQLNEERAAENLNLLTQEEYQELSIDKVIVNRRGSVDRAFKARRGFSFETGVVYSEKYFDGQFGVGSVVGPSMQGWAGSMSTANANGLTTLAGALPGGDPTTGFDILFNGTNFGVVAGINSEAAAYSSTYGANGQLNTSSGTFAGDANGGAVITFDQAGNRGAYVWTKNDGSSQMGADQFLMTAASPARSRESAYFAAPMGGEAAAYDRGTAQLINGEATVTCPDHFSVGGR